MKRNYYLLMCLLGIFLTVSCQKQESELDSDKKVGVYFKTGLPSQAAFKKAVTEPIPTDCEDCLTDDVTKYANITYTINGGADLTFSSEVFIEVEYLPVDSIVYVVTKEELLIAPGDLVIKSFYISEVVGDEMNPKLAIPAESSIYSTFVADALPIEVDILDGERKRYIDLEILCIDLENEPKFGLRYFDLSVVRTMPFCILGNLIDEDCMHSEAEFMLEAYKYSSNTEGPLVIRTKNKVGDDPGFENGDGLDDEDEDALLCTYLPDYTDDASQEFLFKIWVKDMTHPNVETDMSSVYYGYYLLEEVVISEDIIDMVWDKEDTMDNWFHFKISESDNCEGQTLQEFIDELY